MVYFIEGMLSGTVAVLTPYVASDFAEHSLTPTIGILSAVIGGVTNFTIAKILDVFGRPQGFLICILLAVAGLVMMAAARNIETYAAAQVFYAVGNNGVQYTLSVFVADTSSLHNRGLMQAFAYSPNMITCWLAGPISSAFLYGPGWPWAFGMFSILVVAVTMPLFGLVLYHEIQARRKRILPGRSECRTASQLLILYAREFDALGLLLLSSGVALFLLPFNLYTMQSTGWSSPLIICLLVFGIILIVAFVIWEKFFAPISFIPYSLLKNRTILGACFLSSTLFISYFCWNSYFSSFLQAVNNLSVTQASYIVQIYTVGSVLGSVAVGVLIHYTGRFKPATLYFGLPFSILGVGLLIYFRLPDASVEYIVMCQIFIAFAAGTIIICDEIAILAEVDHQHVAAALAALGHFGNIGGAIGLTVAAAIWQAVFSKKLAEYLSDGESENLSLVYSDIIVQLSYDIGSPARVAIQRAYADAQMNLLIAGVAVWALGIVAVLMWRDIRVTNIQRVKGRVV